MPERDIRPRVRRLFRLLTGRRDPATELDDEVRLHLALRTEQLVREGLSPEAARAEAERRFGRTAELQASAARRDQRRHLGERLGTSINA